MGDPHNPGDLTITIKYGKGYDESWAVFRGTQDSIRDQLCTYFNMNDNPELCLHEIVLIATKTAHAGSAVSSIGTPIPASQLGKSSDGPKGDDAWSEAEKKASEPGPNPLLSQVAATETVQALQRVWAENKSEFDSNPELMAAYKTHGQKLQAEQQGGVA